MTIKQIHNQYSAYQRSMKQAQLKERRAEAQKRVVQRRSHTLNGMVMTQLLHDLHTDNPLLVLGIVSDLIKDLGADGLNQVKDEVKAQLKSNGKSKNAPKHQNADNGNDTNTDNDNSDASDTNDEPTMNGNSSDAEPNTDEDNNAQ